MEYDNQNDPEVFISAVGTQEEYSNWWRFETFPYRKDLAIDQHQLPNIQQTLILRPNGVGSRTDLSVSGASSNWQAIDEITSDNDGSFVYSGLI